jgi:hypothetical protein
MELVAGPDPSIGSLPPASVCPRLHPGERPVWIDVSLWEARWPRWRSEAEKRGLPLDAIVSVAVEFSLLEGELRSAGQDAALADLEKAVHLELSECRLAPSDELRLWVDRLLGRSTGPFRNDELPELVLPQRVTQTPRWREALDDAATLESLDLAVGAEVAASRQGLTIEGWMLRRALSA